MTFSILLQRQILKLPRYFWYTSRSVQVSAPYKRLLQIYYFTSFFLKFKSHLLVKRNFFLLYAAFAIATPDLIHVYILHRLLPGYPNSWNIPHSPFALFFHCLHRGRLPYDSHYHSLVNQSCPVVLFLPLPLAQFTCIHNSQCGLPQLRSY